MFVVVVAVVCSLFHCRSSAAFRPPSPNNTNELDLQVIDLHMQLRNYKKVNELWRDMFGDIKDKKRLTSAVYLLGTGANDYLSLFFANSSFFTSYTKSQYVEMVIGNITSVITVSCFPLL